MWKEEDKAELKVKEIMLKALEDKKKEIDPLQVFLGVEIDELKRDIAKLKDEN